MNAATQGMLDLRRFDMVVEGIDVHVEGEGAETVVMIHGWPDTYRLWDAQVDLLSGRRRCVRFTLPGFDPAKPPREPLPDEIVDTIAAIVDRVSPSVPVTLLLHDWGCVFGYQYAMRHAERVDRIVAVDIGDTNSGAFIRSLSLGAKAMVVFYQLWLALAWKLRGGTGTRMTRWMARRLRHPGDASKVTWQMNYPYWHVWTGRAKGSLRVEPPCPIFYAYGERKPFMFHSPKWLERIAALPASKVQAFPSNHWVMLKATDEFNSAMLAWLDTTSSGARTAARRAPVRPPLSTMPG
ncbi:alpha/beta fold hydrolase [Ramlibacter sp.]|uniref:alpha/beta fold hydrolase n=1 Tax=Ramlibacter sp. TaxID=1917967 RepID=UPI003D0CA214